MSSYLASRRHSLSWGRRRQSPPRRTTTTSKPETNKIRWYSSSTRIQAQGGKCRNRKEREIIEPWQKSMNGCKGNISLPKLWCRGMKRSRVSNSFWSLVFFPRIVLDPGELFLADRRRSFQFVIDFSTSRLALKLSVGPFTPWHQDRNWTRLSDSHLVQKLPRAFISQEIIKHRDNLRNFGEFSDYFAICRTVFAVAYTDSEKSGGGSIISHLFRHFCSHLVKFDRFFFLLPSSEKAWQLTNPGFHQASYFWGQNL